MKDYGNRFLHILFPGIVIPWRPARYPFGILSALRPPLSGLPTLAMTLRSRYAKGGVISRVGRFFTRCLSAHAQGV